MVLRINVLRYNRFIFRYQSPFLCEKIEPICLVLVGLTAAGWQVGRQIKYG